MLGAAVPIINLIVLSLHFGHFCFYMIDPSNLQKDILHMVCWCIIIPYFVLDNGTWVEEIVWHSRIHSWGDVLSSWEVQTQFSL